jgi:L-ascorbate metabolism protein UlaG (beta-lactamase superfamily)
MKQPVKEGLALMQEIENTTGGGVSLWWLGQCGFAVKHHDIVFYVDPCFSTPNGLTRTLEAPLDGAQVENADLILCTHADEAHMDPAAVTAMLTASPRAKVVLPKSAAEQAIAMGVPYSRMTTTDSGLRVEYFKNGPYGRVYAIPSAHPTLDWTPLGGYPHLGYLIRFGGETIYHAGDCRLYDGIVNRLRPYNVTAALLPINGNGNFDIAEAAQLAEDIHARWLVPMHFGTFAEDTADINRFVDHLLGFHPSVGFKLMEAGEKWEIPCAG